MRLEGSSIREIEQRLGVARSSVSRWVSGIELTAQLPEASLLDSFVNRYSKSSQRKRTNSLPFGTARLTVHSTRILQTIYGSIQELGDFSRPEWLG
jgi:transcriptional regulator with XRE-family HTH domain